MQQYGSIYSMHCVVSRYEYTVSGRLLLRWQVVGTYYTTPVLPAAVDNRSVVVGSLLARVATVVWVGFLNSYTGEMWRFFFLDPRPAKTTNACLLRYVLPYLSTDFVIRSRTISTQTILRSTPRGSTFTKIRLRRLLGTYDLVRNRGERVKKKNEVSCSKYSKRWSETNYGTEADNT